MTNFGVFCILLASGICIVLLCIKYADKIEPIRRKIFGVNNWSRINHIMLWAVLWVLYAGIVRITMNAGDFRSIVMFFCYGPSFWSAPALLDGKCPNMYLNSDAIIPGT